MAEGVAGDPLPNVTRVALGGAQLSGATVWVQPDYVADQGYVTVRFESQGPRWQPGATAVLSVTQAGGRVHEVPVRIEHEAWHGDQRRLVQVRLRILGADPWSQAEALLSSGLSERGAE